MDKKTPSKTSVSQQQEFAKQVLHAEAQAIERIVIGPEFDQAVELILEAIQSDASGSVVVSGLGKSGLIGRKISATFSSTGTPSHFLHPTEALHGDLGRIRRGDVVVVLSYGEELGPAMKQAVRGMVDFLVKEKGMAPYDAYTLLSLAGDVRVSRTFRPISPVKMMLSRKALEQLG